MRELIENERGFIRSVAMRLDPAERDKLPHDLTTARVESIAYDDSLLVLHLDGYQRPAEWGQHTYPLEGTMRDMDGAVVDVLLLADAAHRLYQLEFVRYSDGPLLRPNWSTLEIAHCSTRQGAK